MDPIAIVNLSLAIADAALSLIARIKANGGLSVEEIVAQADALDLKNKEAISALLAL
jgi:hypothetical protein